MQQCPFSPEARATKVEVGAGQLVRQARPVALTVPALVPAATDRSGGGDQIAGDPPARQTVAEPLEVVVGVVLAQGAQAEADLLRELRRAIHLRGYLQVLACRFPSLLDSTAGVGANRRGGRSRAPKRAQHPV